MNYRHFPMQIPGFHKSEIPKVRRSPLEHGVKHSSLFMYIKGNIYEINELKETFIKEIVYKFKR